MTIFSKEVPVVLGIGSNKGDSAWGNPRHILEGAVSVLGNEVLWDIRRAPFYETEPQGPGDQDWFLNTAVTGFFSGLPVELLEKIHRVEAVFGRDRSQERRWGERTLDIDILLFGDRVIAEPPVLEIPHPRLRERAFALVPLLDLLPGATDPLTGTPYRLILKALPPQGIRPVTLKNHLPAKGE